MQGREGRALRTWKEAQQEGPKTVAGPHVECVSDGRSVIPVVFLPQPREFQCQLDESTPCTVVVDVVSVLNLTEIFGCVVPMLWDGDELHWETIFLDFYQTQGQDAAPRTSNAAAREILRSFGSKSVLCSIVIFDERGDVLFARRLPVKDEQRMRLVEIREVISFLGNYEFVYEWPRLQTAQAAFRSIFCYALASPIPGVFPPGRSALFSSSMIRSLCVDHDQLVDRASVMSRQDSKVELRYDLFISYCHLDAMAATRIADWVRELWPGIRVFVSDPGDVSRAEEDLNYFFKDARRSKALLYLATPNSVARPVVDQEIGTNAHKPIVTAVLGDGVGERLRNYLSKTPFVSLKPEWTVELDGEDGWRKFALLLARALDLDDSAWSNPPQIAPALEDLSSRAASRQAYLTDDWERVKSRRNEQSKDDAERLVDYWLHLLIQQDRLPEPTLQTPSVLARLILVLETLDTPELWVAVLDLVPALVDERFVRDLKKRAELKRINQEEIAAEKLKEMLSLVRRLIQFWNSTIDPCANE
jgi:hypothetical protein